MNRFDEMRLRRLVRESVHEVGNRRLYLFEDDSADDVEINLDVSKGPTAAVAYLNGPGADKRVRALLNAGRSDGSEDDEAATVTEGSARIGDLIPTQVEIELTKSIAYPLASLEDIKKMIAKGPVRVGGAGNDVIVKSGNLIVDGHHRWSSLFAIAGPDGQIVSYDIDLPEKDAASVLAITQAAIASTLSGPVPKAKAGGLNILGKGQGEIEKMIRSAYESGTSGEKGPILSDDFIVQCLEDPAVSKHFKLLGLTAPSQQTESRASWGYRHRLLEKSSKLGKDMDRRITQARNTIINRVALNLSQMKQPAEGAPPRVDMPQLDKAGGGIPGVLDALKSGNVNYKAPFTAESRNFSGQLTVERWQRLAGIIKG